MIKPRALIYFKIGSYVKRGIKYGVVIGSYNLMYSMQSANDNIWYSYPEHLTEISEEEYILHLLTDGEYYGEGIVKVFTDDGSPAICPTQCGEWTL